jgi:hypothetical protein
VCNTTEATERGLRCTEAAPTAREAPQKRQNSKHLSSLKLPSADGVPPVPWSRPAVKERTNVPPPFGLPSYNEVTLLLTRGALCHWAAG